MVDLPTGTVTFLFTDLEGSTRLWEEQPGAMGRALPRHDEILRDAVETHHGSIVKTTGDGIHAAFAAAPDAVAAAIDAQRALTREELADGLPLRVRMGVHTGEAEVRDGDYYGTTANRAARLMAVADGGQILVSRLRRAALVRARLDGSGSPISVSTGCATSRTRNGCSRCATRAARSFPSCGRSARTRRTCPRSSRRSSAASGTWPRGGGTSPVAA